MSKSSKGSQFERTVCKQLSLWWTSGARDDVFWRVSQSGGRATQRAKSGRKTFGSYGDIAFVDPIGEPLLRLFTIELKRGKSHGCPADLIDRTPSLLPSPFEKTLIQTYRAHQAAGSRGWMLICRRDFCIPVLYADTETLRELSPSFAPPYVLFNLRVNFGKGEYKSMRFASLSLERFLSSISPDKFRGQTHAD